MRSGRESLTPRAESFELFGFDVMVDEAPRKTTKRRLTILRFGRNRVCVGMIILNIG